MRHKFWSKNPDKQRIRKRIWRLMENKGIAKFPGAFGRIPNFVGAEKAALITSELEIFKKAKVLKFNPDSPQKKLREIALKQGKIIYMAVPRLTDKECFVMVDPDLIEGRWKEASTIKGAFRLGKKYTHAK